LTPEAEARRLSQSIAQTCVLATKTAAALASEISRPFDMRDFTAIEQHFATLARLRGLLQALVAERAKFLKSDGFRTLGLLVRKAIEDIKVFDADPQRMLMLWNRIIQATRASADQRPTDLYQNRQLQWTPEAQREQAIDRLMRNLHNFVNHMEKQDSVSAEKGHFKDIPLLMSVFNDHMMAAYRVCLAQERKRPVRFLDVGCGGGTKVLSASEYFGHADGLEFDPSYVHAARTLFSNIRYDIGEVFQADALVFDRYDAYDVVYFYRPISNPDLMIQLERRICESVKPGTVLIAPYSYFAERFTDYYCGHVCGNIWLAQTSQAAADQVRVHAETMGSVLVPRPVGWENNAGALRPLVEALHSNGMTIGP
jgi:hypothetical protein